MSSKHRNRLTVRRSSIHGCGVFAAQTLDKGVVLKMGNVHRMVDFRGFNHSCKPNVVFAHFERDVLPVVLRRVARGEELTVSYVRHDPRGRALRPKFACNCGSCRIFNARHAARH